MDVLTNNISETLSQTYVPQILQHQQQKMKSYCFIFIYIDLYTFIFQIGFRDASIRRCLNIIFSGYPYLNRRSVFISKQYIYTCPDIRDILLRKKYAPPPRHLISDNDYIYIYIKFGMRITLIFIPYLIKSFF